MTLDERASALAYLGFSAHQTRFIATVAVHGGYCLRRHYAQVAGLAYGAGVRDFLEAEKLRQALTLVRVERHSEQLDELDVEGILAFAERILPRAADLWVQSSLDQRQRFQQLFFPEGIVFDGNGFVRTAVTDPAFNYLQPFEGDKVKVVDQTGIEPVTS